MALPLQFLLVLAPAIAAPTSPGTNPTRCEPSGDSHTLTTGGLVWSYDAGLYVGDLVLGDRGGQVLAFAYPSIVLFSAFDANPPAPVWQTALDVDLQVARETDLYLVGSAQFVDITTYQLTLSLFTSSSPVPRWSYDFPPRDIFDPPITYDVSRDGQVIVSVLPTSGTAELRRHDPASGIPLETLVLPESYARIQLSPDGSVAGLDRGGSITGRTYLLDLATRSIFFSTRGVLPVEQGLSDGGRVLVVYRQTLGDGWDVRVFAKQGDEYREIVDRRTRLGVYPDAMAVSDDGSTVAIGWYDGDAPRRSIVRAFDVESGSLTMERVLAVPTVPSHNNPITGIAMSADGSRFVVSSWGDGLGQAAELAVYSKWQSQPLVEYPAGGAAYLVRISPDGDRFAAARLSGHPESSGVDRVDVEMYEFGGEDLALRGRPSIGSTVDFELNAAPGATAFLLSSPRRALAPIDVPGAGVLHVGPTLLERAPMGTVPASGVLVHPVAIGNDPALVGRTTYYQSLTLRPRTLTRDWVQLTVLP